MANMHWETIWRDRDPAQVSWFQPAPTRSLDLITACSSPDEPVIDVGAGASSLVDGLLDAGYGDVTALDVSPTALALSRRRLGSRAERVTWIVGDVLEQRFDRTYGVWHDRAAFHFLVAPADRARYVEQLAGAVRGGGHIVLATFGPDGPETCSGLPVQRYGEAGMAASLGPRFELVTYGEESHVTPAGGEQQFAFGVFRARGLARGSPRG